MNPDNPNFTKRCVLLVGPPGAGKSTLAQEYVSNGYIRCSQDEMGRQGHMDVFQEAMKNKEDIIVDRMGFSIDQRARYLEQAKEIGYKTVIIVLHENYETCYKRITERQGHPTIKTEEHAKQALKTFFTKYDRVEDSEADIVERRWPKVTGDLVVCDLDNTLADATHREHLLSGPGKKNWKGFFEAMDKDPVNDWCRKLLNGMYTSAHSGSEIIICSARPADYREITKTWLKQHEVYYDTLVMRAEGDYRKDSITKLQLYEFELKTRGNVLFWVDDRRQVIDEIRKHGVVVLDCANNEW